MKFKSVYATQSTVQEAVASLKDQLHGFDVKMLLYFSSTAYVPEELSREIDQAFPQSETFGCTTSGEIVSGRMLEGSIVAMAISSEAIDDCKVGIIENIIGDADAIDKEIHVFEDHFNSPLEKLNYKDYVGILLIDGMSGKEETVIERIGDFTNIKVVGGSAGDDLQFKTTHVFHNGNAYTNAALLCILKPTTEFDIIKTQSFEPTSNKLIVTKADESQRAVLEFNHQPATKAYADALNTSVDKLQEVAFKNPVGMMVSENEPFVRSPRTVENDTVFFYCSVKEGMELTVLNSTNIIKDTQQAVEQKKNELGNISAIINFHCILRTLDLKGQGNTQEYGEIFNDIPTIGFSTYGECYLGHINQTSTMLVFK